MSDMADEERDAPDPGAPHPATTPPSNAGAPSDRSEEAQGATAGGAGSQGAWHTIGAAAQRAGVHQQTLRHYERLGLITPARRGTRPQSPRLYSDRDIERVVHIRRLMDDLGVNLAGVETILRMRDRIETMRREHEAELLQLRAIIERLQG